MNDYLMGNASLHTLSQKEFVGRQKPLESRIPPVFHEGSADLDPTEWKPSDPGDDHNAHTHHIEADDKQFPLAPGITTASINSHASPSCSSTVSPPGSASASVAGSWKPKMTHRPSSEAFAYLSQFHRSTGSSSGSTRRALRHGSRAMPGLSYTPTPTTSHSSAASSMISDASAGAGPELATTPSFEMVTRPSMVSPPTTAVSTGAILHSLDSVSESEGGPSEDDGGLTLRYEKTTPDLHTTSPPVSIAGGRGPGCGCGTAKKEGLSAKGSLKKLLGGA